MSQPVWVLSVDLQTKTAVFQSGMADAARSARGAFTDIKQGAGEMGRETETNMMEARHGVMLLGEEFGVHLPRALTTFIASIGPVGAAMEAAFPFLAIAVGATLLIEHLVKLREEGEKITENQVKFLTATQNAFNALDQKLLQAGIRADELNKDHIGALHKQLQLIDMQSMEDLVHSFDVVAKAADVVFAGLKTKFYQFDAGSAGAQASLERFKSQYDLLLAKNDGAGATALLDAKVAREQHILDLQKQYKDNQLNASTGKGGNGGQADYLKFEAAALELKSMGVSADEKAVKAQEQLVSSLRDLVTLEAKVADLKNTQKNNAKHATGKTMDEEAFKALKAQIDAEKASNEAEDKLQQEAHNRAIAELQQSEKEKIEATDKGSKARLAAIDAALQEENKYGLQENAFYRGLLTARVQLVRDMALEEAKLKADAGKEAAEHDQKMGELQIAAEREQEQLRLSSHRVTEQQRLAEAQKVANQEFNVKMESLQKQIAALDKGSHEYQNKLKQLQDRELELRKQHENAVTALRDKAEIDRNTRILAAETKADGDIARALTSTLMRHQTFAAMLNSIGDQIASGMMENAIKSILTNDMTKESDAAAAARKAFLAGWHFPFPANIVAAPLMGAAAFASVMAFADGGMVPGVGRGDIVPAMLTPGEHVADKELTDGLRGMVRSGGASGGHTFNIRAHYAPTVSALDSDGVDKVLTKHGDRFQKHIENTLRKMNR
jgi:hypothetical protein